MKEEHEDATGVHMKLKTLEFSDRDTENIYNDQSLNRIILGARYTMMFSSSFLVFSFLQNLANMRKFWGIHVFPILSIACTFAAAIVTYFKKRQRNIVLVDDPHLFANFVTIVFLFVGISLALFTTDYDIEPERQNENAAVIEWRILYSILFMSLVSNGGTISWIRAGIINVIVSLANLVLLFMPPFVQEQYVYISMPFFIISGLAINSLAGWFREYSQRRTFALDLMTTHETRRATEILYQMLPKEIVKKLHAGEEVAEMLPNVSLLFSDIVSFTTLSATCKPEQVVAMLNKLFTAFDKLTEKHNVFKVQTIGDAYVIASGLPYRDEAIKIAGERAINTRNNHAVTPINRSDRNKDNVDNMDASVTSENLVKMAMDMLREVQKVEHPMTGEPIQMRIGIHTGTIIGGVIGNKKLRYDIWGPDVLAANTMETNANHNGILLSEMTKQLLQGNLKYEFIFHQMVDARGLGELETYHVKLRDKSVPKVHKDTKQEESKSQQLNG